MKAGYFFFQAEFGIRYGRVTGVQTCALPISRPRMRPPPARPCPPRGDRAGRDRPRPLARSEERRVGKECKSRWSAVYFKKSKTSSIPVNYQRDSLLYFMSVN